MSTFVSDTVTPKIIQAKASRISRARALELLALAAIVALAAGLHFVNLDAAGNGNHYYTAAVKAMLQSWHNFFFVAAEPGGSVTIDKPPVGLWFQVVSAYFLGVDGWGVILPQILAGILSMLIVYYLVRRWFGAGAGLLASLAWTVTPVVLVVDRSNTMDSTLILTLLLATWAFIKATEETRFRYLFLGAVLVGIGVNIKMLEAYLPLPTFYALYFLGAKEQLWRKTVKLALVTVPLVVVSLSWAVIVDMTPASQRPYIGSSDNNSVINLMLGYNGTQRLLGMGGRGNLLATLFGGTQGGGPGGVPSGGGPGGAPQLPQGQDGNSASQDQGFPPSQGQGRNNGTLAQGFQPPEALGNGGTPPQGFQPPEALGNGGTPPQGFQPPEALGNGGTPPQGFQSPQGQGGNGGGQPGPGGPGGGGPFNTGNPGLTRLFTNSLNKEASWLLPFGLLGMLLLLFRSRLQWPLALKHQAIILWGGWLMAGVVFFSVAGFFHEYYLAIFAAPLAALVGIGTAELWNIHTKHPWLGIALLLLIGGGTLVFQITSARAYVGDAWWLGIGVALFVVGVALLVVASRCRWQRAILAGFIVVSVALLIVPGIWSALTAINSGGNTTIPTSYSGQGWGRGPGGGRNDLNVDTVLVNYLQAHTQGMKYMMAVSSAQQGDDYVLATGRGVLMLGGFGGRDRVATTEDLTRMIANGELRYFSLGGGMGDGPVDQSNISAWVTANCTLVPDLGVATSGTSGATNNRAPSFGPGGPGNMSVTLYDCAK